MRQHMRLNFLLGGHGGYQGSLCFDTFFVLLLFQLHRVEYLIGDVRHWDTLERPGALGAVAGAWYRTYGLLVWQPCRAKSGLLLGSLGVPAELGTQTPISNMPFLSIIGVILPVPMCSM